MHNDERRLEMNHLIHGADRTTHLKIVVIGFVCAALFATVGFSAHLGSVDLGTTALVKAPRSTVISGDLRAIR
jgi:hypothetical protein